MEFLARDNAAIFHTYKRLPLNVVRGEGMELFTADGRSYLDMFGGIAVNALGYNHPALVRAIAEQAARYVHLSNYFAQEPQLRLAERLTGATGFDRVFFCNSGTEAMEGALKLARRWGAGRKKTDLLSFTNAFHGRTYGALSLMDRPKYRDGFGPFLDHCTVIPFNDPAALAAAVSPSTLAIVLECIQGEGGIRPLSDELVETIEELRRKFGVLVIADEVQAGAGRTGRFCSFEHFGFRPDIITMAKPIGGGLPLGAILAGAELSAVLEPGMHGSTFGGNPVACAAGDVVVREVTEGGLMRNAARMGTLLKAGLQSIAEHFPDLVLEVRGFGLMIGLEMRKEGEPVVAAMRERGVLINCTDQTVLRFVPPMIIQENHVDTTLEALHTVLGALR